MSHELVIGILIAEWAVMLGMTTILWLRDRRRRRKVDIRPQTTITLTASPGLYIPAGTPMTVTINGRDEAYITTATVRPGDTVINLVRRNS